jgi:hypothetical protein
MTTCLIAFFNGWQQIIYVICYAPEQTAILVLSYPWSFTNELLRDHPEPVEWAALMACGFAYCLTCWRWSTRFRGDDCAMGSAQSAGMTSARRRNVVQIVGRAESAQRGGGR